MSTSKDRDEPDDRLTQKFNEALRQGRSPEQAYNDAFVNPRSAGKPAKPPPQTPTATTGHRGEQYPEWVTLWHDDAQSDELGLGARVKLNAMAEAKCRLWQMMGAFNEREYRRTGRYPWFRRLYHEVQRLRADPEHAWLLALPHSVWNAAMHELERENLRFIKSGCHRDHRKRDPTDARNWNLYFKEVKLDHGAECIHLPSVGAVRLCSLAYEPQEDASGAALRHFFESGSYRIKGVVARHSEGSWQFRFSIDREPKQSGQTGAAFIDKIYAVFEKRNAEKLHSAVILRELEQQGIKLTKRELAYRLAPFGGKPKLVWVDGVTRRGYVFSEFLEWRERPSRDADDADDEASAYDPEDYADKRRETPSDIYNEDRDVPPDSAIYDEDREGPVW